MRNSSQSELNWGASTYEVATLYTAPPCHHLLTFSNRFILVKGVVGAEPILGTQSGWNIPWISPSAGTHSFTLRSNLSWPFYLVACAREVGGKWKNVRKSIQIQEEHAKLHLDISIKPGTLEQCFPLCHHGTQMYKSAKTEFLFLGIFIHYICLRTSLHYEKTCPITQTEQDNCRIL